MAYDECMIRKKAPELTEAFESVKFILLNEHDFLH